MTAHSLSGRSILVVEDQYVIALDLCGAFQDAGADVAIAGNLREAMRMVEGEALSAAVVDFGLGDENAEALFGRLNARNIPFILHSGYGNHGPAGSRGIVIPKPADPRMLVNAVAGALGLREAVVLSLQSHPHTTTFGPDRLRDIQTAFDDGWKTIASDFTRQDGEQAASAFAKILFDIAGDDRLSGANLTLVAVHEMRRRSGSALTDTPGQIVDDRY